MFHHRFTHCHVHTDNYREIYIFFKQEIGIKKEQGKFEYGLNVELYTLCGNQKMTM